MERFREILIEIWREAARHVDVERAATTIARLLAHRLPLDYLCLLGWDGERSRLSVRAQALRQFPPPTVCDRPLPSALQRPLRAWAQAGRVSRIEAGADPSPLDSLLPPGAEGSWLAGPLWGQHGPFGALVLRALPPAEFTPLHEEFTYALLEPFAVALENDRRIHELAALREAAEADKRSALARLGRTDLKEEVVGADAGLRPVMERAQLVARSDMPVLLLGETGAGKEVVARAIHEASPRGRGPFIRVNCGAIAPELIDSELFGHERGAFTGATATRRGWFERADEGTLLLDEVGELPMPAQVRLLRVLQEGSFERVGGEQLVRVDVRIIAATHRDLPAMVQNGQFREDLWYRIAGFPIVLPPLRERRADIPALAHHFAARAARRFGLRNVPLDDASLELLLAYDWPGNVRELASVMDRAAILGDGERLEVATALGTAPPRPVAAPANRQPDTGARATLATLDAAMAAHIEAALAACQGRIEGARGAASLLAINPHTLRARMRKLGVQWSAYRAESSAQPVSRRSPPAGKR